MARKLSLCCTGLNCKQSRKLWKSLTPSKPMCQTRACSEPQWTEDQGGGRKSGLKQNYPSAVGALFQAARQQRPTQGSTLTVGRPHLIRHCVSCALYYFPKMCCQFFRLWEKEDFSRSPCPLPPFAKRLGGPARQSHPNARFKCDLPKSVHNLNIH